MTFQVGSKVWYLTKAGWGAGTSVKLFATIEEINGLYATIRVWNGGKNKIERVIAAPTHMLRERVKHFPPIDGESK